MSNWTPLSRRGSQEHETLYEGVPQHLYEPLRQWLGHWGTQDIFVNVALRARVPYECQFPDDGRYRISALLAGASTRPNPTEALLDLVEGVLHERQHEVRPAGMRSYGPECAEKLEKILESGGSKWRVAQDRLEGRVDDNVRQAVERARQKTPASSASAHLGNAWVACYGRNPNPSHAYSEAIKAVEAAAARVISPKDLKATLGTMLGHLRPNAAQYRFSIAPRSIDPVIAATSTLWDGQTDRHGGNRPTVPISPDAAEAAVLLAATLVHWFASGAVQRR